MVWGPITGVLLAPSANGHTLNIWGNAANSIDQEIGGVDVHATLVGVEFILYDADNQPVTQMQENVAQVGPTTDDTYSPFSVCWHVGMTPGNSYTLSAQWAGTPDGGANTYLYGNPFTFPLVACIAAGCRVAMADGSARPIEDIVAGDAVAAPDGDAYTVSAVLRGARVNDADALGLIPAGLWGATADVVATRNHGFYTSVAAYCGKDAMVHAPLPVAADTDVSRIALYNLQLARDGEPAAAGGVMLVNGVCAVGMGAPLLFPPHPRGDAAAALPAAAAS